MKDLLFSSTTELSAAIQAGEVSSVEVVDAHLKQIERHNPALNAVVTLDAESARKRAQEADAALARGEVWGPLHGVPFTLKDCHATAGLRTTCGFPPLAGYVPEQDSTVTGRLKAAGGIMMGKTNVPLLLGDPLQTTNPLFGRTNNPWNLERTPGGSSGGAAAALASGMTPFEVGTDLAGSTRIPANFCGLFGLKTTENRIPLTGLVAGPPDAPRSVRLMTSICPMARTVDDLALIFSILAGPDGHDTEVQPVPVAAVPVVNLQQIRVAYATTLAGFPTEQAIQQAIEKLAEQLRSQGATVEAPPLPEPGYNPQKFGELVGMMIGAFQPSEDEPATLANYLAALHERDQLISAWESFFEQWDVLICPTAAVTAFTHRESGAPLTIDGHNLDYWAANVPATLFNYTGHPAVAIPLGMSSDGLPLGVQVGGKRWGEARLLGIVKAITEISGGFQRPKGY